MALLLQVFRLRLLVGLLLLVACGPKQSVKPSSQLKSPPVVLQPEKLVVDTLPMRQWSELQKFFRKAAVEGNWYSATLRCLELAQYPAPADLSQGQLLVYKSAKTDSLVRLEWRINAFNRIKWSFSPGPPHLALEQLPERIAPRLVGGRVVEGSLLQTLIGLNLPRDMVRKLTDAYDWSVDFFELEPEDEVRVHAFERLAGDSVVGIDRLDGAVILQGKEKFYAFAWHHQGQLHYLNEKGEFLRRRFLRSPLDYAEISSGFSYSRFHPIMHRFQPHLGIDYVAPIGSPVRAVADGRVKEAGFKGGNGLYVKLEHGEHETGYLHLNALGAGVSPGLYVRQGQVIGYLGSTGLSTGPHLCFRYWRNGVPANPDLIAFNAGPAQKLPEPELSQFLETITTLKNRLDEFHPVQEPTDPIGF